jgi:hypothetical protein
MGVKVWAFCTDLGIKRPKVRFKLVNGSINGTTYRLPHTMVVIIYGLALLDKLPSKRMSGVTAVVTVVVFCAHAPIVRRGYLPGIVLLSERCGSCDTCFSHIPGNGTQK